MGNTNLKSSDLNPDNFTGKYKQRNVHINSRVAKLLKGSSAGKVELVCRYR